jgi:hypothetical protein
MLRKMIRSLRVWSGTNPLSNRHLNNPASLNQTDYQYDQTNNQQDVKQATGGV